MKKIVLLFFSAFLAVNIYAQTPGATEKNAGNAAWKAKNYQEAFKNFEAYLKLVEYKDKAYMFNTAVAAMKAKKYPEAVKYFDMAIQAKYKVGASYNNKSIALREQGDITGMLATLKEGMQVVPAETKMKLETMYATHYMKEGQKFQKANNIGKAQEAYNMIVELNNKSFKVQGYLSLGMLYFNHGAMILQEVNPLANTDKEKYEAGKAKAMVSFKKAKVFAEKAQGIEPANADVKELMGQLAEAMK